MRYLLDTNILSLFARNRSADIAKHIQRVGEANIFTSIIVAAELRFGAAKHASPQLQKRIEELLNEIDIEPLDHPADMHYGILRASLEKRGLLIGGNDMLIAAQALASDATLVTANIKEFRRVDHLNVENWA